MLADTPLAQVVEADSANSYGKEGVSEYRRLCALIGEGKSVTCSMCSGLPAAPARLPVSLPDHQCRLCGGDAGPGRARVTGRTGHRVGQPAARRWRHARPSESAILESAARAMAMASWSRPNERAPTAPGPQRGNWMRSSALRLHLLGAPGTEVITAIAPGLYPRLAQGPLRHRPAPRRQSQQHFCGRYRAFAACRSRRRKGRGLTPSGSCPSKILLK